MIGWAASVKPCANVTENILGANQSLHANYENFNLGHRINIQGACGLGNFTIWTRPWIG